MLLRELFFKQLNEATLRRGSRGNDVKALQRALGIRPADGIFGPQTERAVRNFQTAAQITVDGIAGGQTQAAIRRFAEEPGASSDYGQIRPGTDWSSLDPGEIEVTPRQEPERQAGAGPAGAGPEIDTTAPEQPQASQNQIDRIVPGLSNNDDESPRSSAPEQPTAQAPDAVPAGPDDEDAAQRREIQARQETEQFVRSQVAELTRIRRNMPNDQLIRNITQRAVEQGLNDGWRERGAMAAYIAELVPTIDRSAGPEIDTTSPGQLSSPNTGGDDAGRTVRQDDNPTAGQAPTRIQAPTTDATPSVDSTAAAAQQLSRFQQVYGVGTGGDGLPTLFRDRFLNPVLDNLESRTMQALSAELEGEIPQAPARVIVQRLEQTYGNEQELQQAAQEMRGDTDPEIQDQVRALEVLIPLLRKLKQDAARPNESVEIDRIKMLAGV